MLRGNKTLHGNLRKGSFPSFLWVVMSHLPPFQSVLLRQWGRMGERTIFCKSFWLHVKCRMEMSLSVFNFFFFYTGYDVLVKTHSGKNIKNRELQLFRHFTCNQIELKLSNFLLHYCHLMMAVPLKILFLLICFASKKMLFGSRHVLNISLLIQKSLLSVFALHFEELIMYSLVLFWYT